MVDNERYLIIKQVKITNISQIKNITTLEELAKYDDIIRKTCKRVINPINYDDVVNETYIKLDFYMKKGVIVNSGYIYLCMKTINLNMIKSSKNNQHIEMNDSIERIIDDYDENYYEEIDNKLDIITDFLNEFLNQDQIYLYQYYKLNGLKSTAIFFQKSDSSIKYRIKKIYQKIRLNGGLPSLPK